MEDERKTTTKLCIHTHGKCRTVIVTATYPPKTGFERTHAGRLYYTMGGGSYVENTDGMSLAQFLSGDYVTDERLRDMRETSLALHNKIAQWQALHDEPVDWNVTDNHSTVKYKIVCDYSSVKPHFFVDKAGFYREPWVIYFSTKEKAQEALDSFERELMWYALEYYPRLDSPKIRNKGVLSSS